ncbi:hypothetical protein [Symbiobacterium terraclitae]|uniref:hypothetical protein n=1 Tax=Symbiobacterium terraclitae TaxID=557451 RepID=UPI0035B516DB
MLLYGAALLVAFLIGWLLPHPLGLILLGTMALGAVWRLGDRVSRLEAVLRDRLGGMLEENPYESRDAYMAERARIRARMEQYRRQAEEEKR